MRMMKIALAATALSVAWCGQAWADDAKEKALEQKIDDLQKQLDEVTRRLGDGSDRAGDELEQRVSELEKLSKKDKDGLFPYWGNGIRMDSADGTFKIVMGGRIQSDWTWFSHTSDAEAALGSQIEAGEEFRRARLMMGGQIYKNIQFSAEYDFAGGTAVPRDVWLAAKNLPGNTMLQVGNIKEPTGTEELTSDLFIPFLERSAGNEAFAPDYKTGFMASGNFCENEGSFQAGVFRDSAASGNSTGNKRSGDYNFTGRVAGRPWKNDDGSQFLTVGVAASNRSPTGDVIDLRAHPELHIAPRFVDTGAMPAHHEYLIEADAGFVMESFWAFADFFDNTVSRAKDSNVTFTAWQLAVGYFLTGETKPYKASNSTYDRIKPKTNFDGSGGMGAWELAARVSELDLNDDTVSGGKLQTFTVGVSWYLNPNTRWMLDLVHTKNKTLDISINGVETRFQIDF